MTHCTVSHFWHKTSSEPVGYHEHRRGKRQNELFLQVQLNKVVRFNPIVELNKISDS